MDFVCIFLTENMLVSYGLAVAILGGTGILLAVIMAIADATLANYGECEINMGEERKPLKVRGGSHLLSYLFANRIFVPSACGGQGSCGYCKLKVLSGGGPVLPTEVGFLNKKEIRDNWRLSCQVKVKQDVKIFIPEEYLAIQAFKARVVSNRNVATYIKELVLELLEPKQMKFKAGQYVQFHIPKFKCTFRDFQIDPIFQDAYKPFWDMKVESKEAVIYRAYSMANAPYESGKVILNVRIATPPKGKKCPPGLGSSYIFNLKPNEEIEISGPYGEFLIKDTDREMMYIGGGAGMAPMRSHLFYLLKEKKSQRQITYWYGARSMKEMFYHDDFNQIAQECPNFKYTVALSEKQPGDQWNGPEGFIHDVCDRLHLSKHPDPRKIEYYLCGPPLMIDAVLNLLHKKYHVPNNMIAFDKF